MSNDPKRLLSAALVALEAEDGEHRYDVETLAKALVAASSSTASTESRYPVSRLLIRHLAFTVSMDAVAHEQDVKAVAKIMKRGGSMNKTLEERRSEVKARFGELFEEAWKHYPIPAHRLKRPAAKAGIKRKARSRAYAWLAVELGLPVKGFKLSTLNEVDCRNAMSAMRGKDADYIRQWALNRDGCL